MLIAGGSTRLVSRSGEMAVELALVKSHIQLSHSADDAMLTSKLIACIEEVENRGSVALTTQSRVYSVPAKWSSLLAGETLHLPHSPISAITALGYIDADGVPRADFTDYRLVAGEAVYFGSVPSSLAGGDGAITITYTCGYGDTEADVPPVWKELVMQLCFRRFEFRDGVSGQQDLVWERAFDRQVVAAGGERLG